MKIISQIYLYGLSVAVLSIATTLGVVLTWVKINGSRTVLIVTKNVVCSVQTVTKWLGILKMGTRHCPYCESEMPLLPSYCPRCGKKSYPY